MWYDGITILTGDVTSKRRYIVFVFFVSVCLNRIIQERCNKPPALTVRQKVSKASISHTKIRVLFWQGGTIPTWVTKVFYFVQGGVHTYLIHVRYAAHMQYVYIYGITYTMSCMIDHTFPRVSIHYTWAQQQNITHNTVVYIVLSFFCSAYAPHGMYCKSEVIPFVVLCKQIVEISQGCNVLSGNTYMYTNIR